MTKNNKRLIIFFILILCFIILILKTVKVPCLFKKIFKIPCPGCGLTRSITSLLKFNFKASFYYNILGIPLAILFIIVYSLIIIDIIKKKNYLSKFISFILKQDKIIIILLIITFIINNIHKI